MTMSLPYSHGVNPTLLPSQGMQDWLQRGSFSLMPDPQMANLQTLCTNTTALLVITHTVYDVVSRLGASVHLFASACNVFPTFLLLILIQLSRLN